MIYIVNSCRWKKIKQKDNIVETSNLIDTDIVYIGENVTKCVEYVEYVEWNVWNVWNVCLMADGFKSSSNVFRCVETIL